MIIENPERNGLGNELYCRDCDLILRGETACPSCGEKKLILASMAPIWCRMCGNKPAEKENGACADCADYFGGSFARHKLERLEYSAETTFMKGGGNV